MCYFLQIIVGQAKLSDKEHVTYEAEAIGFYVLTRPDTCIRAKEYPVRIFYEELPELFLVFIIHHITMSDEAADAGVDIHVGIFI